MTSEEKKLMKYIDKRFKKEIKDQNIKTKEDMREILRTHKTKWVKEFIELENQRKVLL